MNAAPAARTCNAWIYLDEDEPQNPQGIAVSYTEPSSMYQKLIANNVYRSVDMLFLCFAETVPTSSVSIPPGDASSYTIRIEDAPHPQWPKADDGTKIPQPVRFTNQNYMEFIQRDARANNPSIKILMTLVWGRGIDFESIFLPKGKTDVQNAQAFAANLLTYLRRFNLDGFDIDWEPPLSDNTSQTQMTLLLNAIGSTFRAQTRKYWLTLSPAVADHLNGSVVNANVDFLNLQLYSGETHAKDFTAIGINPSLLAYGAKFESEYETAKAAYSKYRADGYRVTTAWRLNSGNFGYEQAQQIAYHALVHAA